MKKFLKDRQHLAAIDSFVRYSEEERPHLLINHPAILATFIGYLKFQTRMNNNAQEVFFRGQTKNHMNVIPSLLRGNDLDKINIQSDAYDQLKKETKDLFKANRFQNETIDNYFQHYGIRSKTLDLVDNIYTAVWFATNEWIKINELKGICTYRDSSQQYGWIYFMLVDAPKQIVSSQNPSFSGYCDLRKYHSSLSARLHCQHGITYFRDNEGKWTEKNRNFNNLVLASVKFPNTEKFHMNGTLITKEFLFPSINIDNTYKLLRMKKFELLLKSIESKFNIATGDLGRIWQYN